MSDSIRTDVQMRGEKIAQRWHDANHDVRVLEMQLERAVLARDKADEDAEELQRVANLLGMTIKKPSLLDYPSDELTGQVW